MTTAIQSRAAHPIDAITTVTRFVTALAIREAGLRYEMEALTECGPHRGDSADYDYWDNLLYDCDRARNLYDLSDNQAEAEQALDDAGLHEYAQALRSGDYSGLAF